MGLDLYLIEDSKCKWHDDGDHGRYPEWDWESELCYGRKTWGIFNWFIMHSDKVFERSYLYHIPASAAKEFVEYVEPYVEKLENFLYEYDIAFGDNEWVSKMNSGKFDSVLDFIDDMDDCGPQLGYEWEARAILRWYNALKDYKGNDGFVLYGSW